MLDYGYIWIIFIQFELCVGFSKVNNQHVGFVLKGKPNWGEGNKHFDANIYILQMTKKSK